MKVKKTEYFFLSFHIWNSMFHLVSYGFLKKCILKFKLFIALVDDDTKAQLLEYSFYIFTLLKEELLYD